MLQASQEPTPKQEATTKIWWPIAVLQELLVLNISKITKLKVPKLEEYKWEFINLFKAFLSYWLSIHSKLKAVVNGVNSVIKMILFCVLFAKFYMK